MRSARAWLWVAGITAALAAGCGDDSGSAANPPPTAAAAKNAAAVAAAAGGAKTQLPEKLHVEDRVTCAIPEKPSDPEATCDPKAPSCPDRLYCMTLASGSFCEPCPERDGIRHLFKERDFVAEQNRDPFEPGGTLISKGTGGQMPPTEKCRRDDQFVASSYSYVDLKLVGIIAQGTQRKVLMMGGPLGYIIKRGDCVGKEKAVVTDIGTGYITFQIDPDPLSGNQRPASEYSVQLNPKQLAANDPNEFPQTLPRTTIAPLVAPPVLPPSGAPRGTTVIVPGTAPAPGTVVSPSSNIAPAVPPGTAPGTAVAPQPAAVTGAGSAMAPGTTVPLVVPASPAAPGSGAPPGAPAPSVPTPTAPARVFVPAPRR